MLAREEARLRALFHRMLAVSLAAAGAAAPAACGTSSPPPKAVTTTTSDAGIDATIAPGSADSGGSSAPDAPSNDATTAPDTSTGDDDAGSDATVAPTEGGGEPCDATPEPIEGASDGSGCDTFVLLGCGLPPDAATENCYLSLSECPILCGRNVACRVFQCDDAGVVATSGPLWVECGTFKIGCGGVGRRPRGLAATRPEPRRDLAAAWLAEAAHLEAASVHAFLRLREELTSFGAPRALARAAGRSARDELRHARTMTRLARRHGATPARVLIDRRATRARSVEAFAIENAVEGCVRETFGALVATRQGERAADASVRRTMKRIAQDETRHAAAAWAIAGWLAPKLDPAARARIERSVRGALQALRCEVAGTDPRLSLELGVPCGAEGASLVDAFAASVREHLHASDRA